MRIILALLICMLMATHAHARDTIRVVGSSTVYPFMASVAEHFGEITNNPTPLIVESGTGQGIADFCKGVGEKYPDMVNASRLMKKDEEALCHKAGVKNIHAFTLGFDGIVFANAQSGETLKITTEQLFLAMAKRIAKNGKLIANPYKYWDDIDASLPKNPIEIYGPPSTSGTYDAFIEIVMQGACMQMKSFERAIKDKEKRKQACSLIRDDGVYKPAVENDNIIVQKLKANEEAFGIFGFSYLDQNADTLKGAEIDGVAPTYEAVSDGSYPISRSLYVYVKGEHMDLFPAIKELMEELYSDDAMGELGYLPMQGLITLPEEKLEEQRDLVDQL